MCLCTRKSNNTSMGVATGGTKDASPPVPGLRNWGGGASPQKIADLPTFLTGIKKKKRKIGPFRKQCTKSGKF